MQVNCPDVIKRNHNIEKNKRISFARTTSPIIAEQALPMEKSNIEAVKSYVTTTKPLNYKKLEDLKIPFTDPVKQYKLENGQTVLFLNKKGPTVINTYFNVGSMNEPDYLRGISHFVEHNLFNGTENLQAGEFFSKTNELGAQVNASTGFSQTNYYINTQLLEKDDFLKAVKLHADIIQNPAFTINQIEKEKGPVTSEISMVNDMPDNKLINLCIKNLFQINTTSQDLIAGSVENIKNIKREDVLDYYNKYYTPDNAVTVITGEVDERTAIEALARNFSTYKRSNNPTKKYEELKHIDNPLRTDLKSAQINSTAIALGFKGPANKDIKAKIALSALATLLCNNSTSRLNKKLNQVSTSADIAFEKISNKQEDPGVILITTKSLDGLSEDTIKIIYDEITNVSSNPINEAELTEAKKRLKLLLSDISENSFVLNSMLGESFLDGDLNQLPNYLNIVESLTAEDILNVAKKYLDLNRVSLTLIHPNSVEDKTILKNHQNSKSKKATPSFGSTVNNSKTVIDTEKIEQYRLGNNLELILNANSSSNLTSRIVLNAKTPANVNPAVPIILTGILNQGSMQKDWKTYFGIANSNIIDLNFSADDKAISVASKSIDENLDLSMQLIKETLLNPRFTEKDFETAKKLAKSKLISRPNSVDNLLYEKLFPNFPSYASKLTVMENIDKVTLEDVMGFYYYIMQNAQAKATITAPFAQKPQLKQTVFDHLSQDFRPFKEFERDMLDVFEPIKTTGLLLQKEERNQAEIGQMYTFKTTRNLEDMTKMQLLNIILGSSPTSRLFSDLREDKRLAYRVNSSLDFIQDTGLIKLFISTTTNDKEANIVSPRNVTEALEGFKRNIELLKTKDVEDMELRTAKNILKTRLLNTGETSTGQNSAISTSFSTPYGIDSLNQMLKIIDTISKEDLRACANYMFKDSPINAILASEDTINYAKNNIKTA